VTKLLSNKKKSLVETHPELLTGWDWEYNNGIGVTPDAVSYGSQKRVRWVCSFGHRWECKIGNRTILGRGCPYCYGRYATREKNLLVILRSKCDAIIYCRNY
jgi:hypothetical protein